MNKLMLSFLCLFLPALSFAAVSESDRALVERSRNLLTDGGFEAGGGGWTASPTSTFTIETLNPALGSNSGIFDSTASSQELATKSITVPQGLYAKNGLARCMFKTTATDYLFQVLDLSANTLASTTIPANSNFGYVSLNFIFPSGVGVRARILSQSNAAAVTIDDCYLGPASNLTQVGQAAFVGSGYIATGSNCTWARASTQLGPFNPTATCPGPTVEENPGPGSIQTTDTDLPKFTVNSLPPGYYEVIISVTTLSSTVSGQQNTLAINDGTSTRGQTTAFGASPSAERSTTRVVAYFNYTTSGNRTFELYGASDSGTFTVQNEEALKRVNFSIMRFPSSSELALMPDQVGWRVDANISGANPSLGLSAVSSYTGIENASLALTNNTSSTANVLTAQIPCSSTNAPSGTTCSAGNESVGVTFNVPTAGDVRACVSFTHYMDIGVTTNLITSTFQIVETPSNAQTISQEGKSRVSSGIRGDVEPGANLESTIPHQLCGTFSFSSAGQRTLRLMYEQAVGGTPSNNILRADADASNGQRDIHWEVYPITQAIPAPIILNQVQTSNSGGIRTESARFGGASAFTSCTSSPCTVHDQGGGSWLASSNPVTRGGSSGTYTITFASGAFSSAPTCICNGRDPGQGPTQCSQAATSTTSTTINNAIGITNQDSHVQIVCQGPR